MTIVWLCLLAKQSRRVTTQQADVDTLHHSLSEYSLSRRRNCAPFIVRATTSLSSPPTSQRVGIAEGHRISSIRLLSSPTHDLTTLKIYSRKRLSYIAIARSVAPLDQKPTRATTMSELLRRLLKKRAERALRIYRKDHPSPDSQEARSDINVRHQSSPSPPTPLVPSGPPLLSGTYTVDDRARFKTRPFDVGPLHSLDSGRESETVTSGKLPGFDSKELGDSGKTLPVDRSHQASRDCECLHSTLPHPQLNIVSDYSHPSVTDNEMTLCQLSNNAAHPEATTQSSHTNHIKAFSSYMDPKIPLSAVHRPSKEATDKHMANLIPKIEGGMTRLLPSSSSLLSAEPSPSKAYTQPPRMTTEALPVASSRSSQFSFRSASPKTPSSSTLPIITTPSLSMPSSVVVAPLSSRRPTDSSPALSVRNRGQQDSIFSNIWYIPHSAPAEAVHPWWNGGDPEVET